MIRLLYISETTVEMSAEKIHTIRQQSQRNNAMLGITGLMLTGGGVFAQVLEGPELNVLRLYVKIMEDSRHFNCQLVHISPVKELFFKNWFMAVIEATPLEFEHIAELRARREESVSSVAFTNLMQQFVVRLKKK
jgi:hypothetical protein